MAKDNTGPLAIGNEMRQFDRKNREFYDSLTPEEQKKFSPYLMIRWGSAVEGSADLQQYYLMATNERLNRYFFDLSKNHRKLQWLLATTVSPGLGSHRHKWIPPRKKSGDSKHRRRIEELFPHLRDDELDVLAKINTPEEIDQYIQDLGQQ
jgi:hypothetical protein